MEEIKASWTKEEFKAYLLIYAAQSNQIETDEEKEFISHKFDSLMLKSIYKVDYFITAIGEYILIKIFNMIIVFL